MSDEDFGLIALMALGAICALVFILDWNGYRRCQRDAERPGPKPAETDWAESYAASEQGETLNPWKDLP